MLAATLGALYGGEVCPVVVPPFFRQSWRWSSRLLGFATQMSSVLGTTLQFRKPTSFKKGGVHESRLVLMRLLSEQQQTKQNEKTNINTTGRADSRRGVTEGGRFYCHN